MGKGWKIGIGLVGALVIALAINAIVVDRDTKAARVTVSGGRILSLHDGEIQVFDRGPRRASPIVLIHCYTCAIDWWDAMIPLLDRNHRLIAVDLRGFGGSEKPLSGYSMPDQADLVAEALARLGVRRATVAGHSLGGTVATALAERHPGRVGRLAIIDQAPDGSYGSGPPLIARLSYLPVIGEGLWQVTPDFAIKDGLSVAFAPGFEVPDRFVDDFRRMTYTSFSSDGEEGAYSNAVPLDRRIARSGVPLMAIFGAEDQIYDSKAALSAYRRVPRAVTALIPGAGHSPNVERPARTAALLLRFAGTEPKIGNHLQKALQKRDTVRQRP